MKYILVEREYAEGTLTRDKDMHDISIPYCYKLVTEVRSKTKSSQTKLKEMYKNLPVF